jgi:acyl-coenzyme A thioesterase PaaI-like protein
MKLRFEPDGQALVARVELDESYESFPGTIHGGIVATLLDESMGRAVYHHTGTPGVTLTLRTRYAAPVRTGAAYRVRGEILTRQGGHVRARAELLDRAGALVAAGEATFLLASEHGHTGI